MKKNYIYKSLSFHIVIILLCVLDLPFLQTKIILDEEPPIIVNLDDIKLSDLTNLPEKAIQSDKKQAATRKETKETFTKKVEEKKQEVKPIEEKIEESKPIQAPSLVTQEPKEKPVEVKKKIPIPAKKPAPPKPEPKPEPKPIIKKEEPKQTIKKEVKKEEPKIKATNPLESLMSSVDDLQKEIGKEDKPAQILKDEPIVNTGIEGGTSKGSYFSELSISGIDFIKSKIQESWKTIAGGKDDRNIAVVINVKVTKEGIIQSVSIEDMKRYRSDVYYQALADSAERAIYIAQDVHNVFNILATKNSSNYNDWKDIKFTFTPLGLSK